MNVTPRKWYVVTTDSECVVTDANGKVLCTATAGEQKLFYATTPVVTLSDETATVGEANFKRAALALGLLGGGEPSWLTALKRELAFILDGARVQYKYSSLKKHLLILTDLSNDSLNDSVWAVCARFAPQGTTYEVFNLNKYAECKTVEELYAVNSDFRNDLTSDGEWIYPLTQLQQMASTNEAVGGSIFYKATNLRIFKQTLPKLSNKYASNIWNQVGAPFEKTSLEYAEINVPVNNPQGIKGLFKSCPVTLKEAVVIAPYAKELSETFEAIWGSSPQLKKVTINSPNATSAYDLFLWQAGLEEVNIDFNDSVTEGHNMYYECKNLKTFPTSYAKLYKGDGMFHNCRITGQQAIEILNSLPAYENDPRPMTMGIHVDYKTDEEVLAAIDSAEAKGWTMTIQWNGTPAAQTASTFGLRKPPIYAKLATSERPDGTTERVLDWGHYVTNWEEHGYMEFASLDEAREYFNITE